MPSSLVNAYGKTWGSKNEISQLGTQVEEVITRLAEPVRIEKGTVKSDEKKYIIEIHIDQQDCHLICLFIGVFTLSILLNRSRNQNM